MIDLLHLNKAVCDLYRQALAAAIDLTWSEPLPEDRIDPDGSGEVMEILKLDLEEE